LRTPKVKQIIALAEVEGMVRETQSLLLTPVISIQLLAKASASGENFVGMRTAPCMMPLVDHPR
jgi:hypothetical protein